MPPVFDVGVAQKIILDALGLDIRTFQGAEAKFAELGIVVQATRKGRRSVPLVRLRMSGTGGAFTLDGDGETWPEPGHRLTPEQVEAIRPWLAWEHQVRQQVQITEPQDPAYEQIGTIVRVDRTQGRQSRYVIHVQVRIADGDAMPMPFGEGDLALVLEGGA